MTRLTDLIYGQRNDLVGLAAAGGIDIASVVNRTLYDPAREAMEAFQRQDDLYRRIHPGSDLMRAAEEAIGIWRYQDDALKAFGLGGISDAARRAADLAMGLQMPDILAPYRPAYDDMAWRAMMLSPSLPLQETATMAFLTNASALAHIYDQFDFASRAMAEATRAFQALDVFDGSIADMRSMLDISGLRLGRWPRFKLLTLGEKRRKFRAKLSQNSEPRHVKRAKSLVHQYELTLRDLLDQLMADTYGENWPEERLPLCDGKTLLGRWRKNGGVGAVLDYADYHHYAELVGHPEHFEAIFARGFEDSGEARRLFESAGNLRAASHHARPFTPDDLKDLTLVWQTIVKALLGLMDDYELDY